MGQVGHAGGSLTVWMVVLAWCRAEGRVCRVCREAREARVCRTARVCREAREARVCREARGTGVQGCREAAPHVSFHSMSSGMGAIHSNSISNCAGGTRQFAVGSAARMGGERVDGGGGGAECWRPRSACARGAGGWQKWR